MSTTGLLSCFVITAPGLEVITGTELARLGLTVTATEPGGLSFDGTLADVARANLWLRTASRVLVRITSFNVRALGELERKAGLIPWRDWLPAGVPVALKVTSRKSRLYHQKAIAERIGNALRASHVELAAPAGDPEEDDTPPGEAPSQLISVRLHRDVCTISLDSSGALLHRRGYRLATAKAPLRETLAAALLLASGWTPERPLLDPFCGSGTIPIEAARLARRMAPGRHRPFACQRWPGWSDAAWTALLAEADAGVLPNAGAAIVGSDRDAGAMTAAAQNAERAGVAGDLQLVQRPIAALEAPSGVGALVSNPPYGVRVSDARALKDLYGMLGEVSRARLSGWQLTLLLPEAPLERATGLRWEEQFRSRNGGLQVRCVRAEVG